MPFTIATARHSELIIKKSRFIGCVEPVSGREEAVARVEQLRVGHPDSRHVCWALMAGGQSAANDDGEPGGTAGRPMLEVLRHQELEGVLATVVRYFGGIKLGAGGLVRAYTDAVAQALVGAERVLLVPTRAVDVAVPYTLEGVVRRELDSLGAALLDVRHGRDVELSVQVAEDRLIELTTRVNDLTGGRAVWT